MKRKIFLGLILIIFYYGIRITSSIGLKDSEAQCLSITDGSNNSDPTFNLSYGLTPDIGATSVSMAHDLRIRTSAMAWRLQASRSGPTRTSGSGSASDNIAASDINYAATLTGVMTMAGTATLIAPFNATTTQASINTTNTPVINGTARTAANCNAMSGTYWQYSVTESIYPDFLYNIGTYRSIVSYILTAP